jgi:hypothetical protein
MKQKKQYDRYAGKRKWTVGMLVWLFNPTKMVGRSPKLTIFWEEEPWEIVEIVNDVTMRIQRRGSQKSRVVHVDRLKPVELRKSEETVGVAPPRVREIDFPYLGEDETVGDGIGLMEKAMNPPMGSILVEMGLVEVPQQAVVITRSGRPSKPPARLQYGKPFEGGGN